MFSFEKLNVYNEAVNFAEKTYKKTLTWPSKYQYNLSDQFRRASLSISLNIAEGSSRTRTEFKRFLGIARGSTFECIPIIEIAYRLKLLSTKESTQWYNHCVSLGKMMSKLKSSL